MAGMQIQVDTSKFTKNSTLHPKLETNIASQINPRNKSLLWKNDGLQQLQSAIRSGIKKKGDNRDFVVVKTGGEADTSDTELQIHLNEQGRFKESNAVNIIQNSTIEFNKDYSSRSKERKRQQMEEIFSIRQKLSQGKHDDSFQDYQSQNQKGVQINRQLNKQQTDQTSLKVAEDSSLTIKNLKNSI